MVSEGWLANRKGNTAIQNMDLNFAYRSQIVKIMNERNSTNESNRCGIFPDDGGGVFAIGVECLLFGTPISNAHCHGMKLYTTPSKHD